MADLSAAVDVYSEWVDAAGTRYSFRFLRSEAKLLTAADAVAHQGREADDDDFRDSGAGRLSSGRAGASKGRVDAYDDDDERDYGGEGVVADDDDYE